MGYGMRHVVGLGTLVIAAATGCDKEPPIGSQRVKARLQVSASVLSAGEELDIVVEYRRVSGPGVRLARSRTPLGAPGPVDVPIELDLAACLADPQRAGGSGAGCPIVAAVVLRDAGGVAMDSAGLGPFEVREGASVSAPAAVTLQAAATLTIESGDQQLGWVGEALHVPLVVRLTDRAGGPVAGRALTVNAVSGGGSVVGTGPFVTGADGRVTIGYRLGSTVGPQAMRIAAAAGGATVTATASLHGVEVRRERVVAGFAYSCAILGGSTRCWGASDAGTLGNRALAIPRDTLFPMAVANAPPFVALAANKANNIYTGSVCGLTATGAVYCWGLQPDSELGFQAPDSCTPFGQAVTCAMEPQLASGSRVFATVDVGSGASTSLYDYPTRVCGVSTNGDAYCWGENAGGALGDGTTTARSVPTLVGGGRKWIDISTGTFQSCGVAVTGQAYCWGSNRFGNLGTGDTVSSPTPRAIASTDRFVAIDVGSLHACALTTTGEIRCWGLDDTSSAASSGGLGNSLVPVAPAGNAPALVRFSLGLSHGCGVSASRAGYCWGRNRQGSFGDGTSVNLGAIGAIFSYSFSRVAGGLAFSEIGAGFHSCALAIAGDAHCWGRNLRGELGNGNRVIVGVPSRVTLGPVSPGAPTQVVRASLITSPWARGLACPGSLQVQVLDGSGHIVPNAAVQFSTPTAGASVSSPSVLTSASGAATSSCTLSATPGLNVFVVKAALAPNDSVTFVVDGRVPQAPATASCRSCQVSTPVGTLVASLPTVVVSDAAGVPVPGVPVTFSRASPGGAVFTPALPATVTTNAVGEATLTSWRADTLSRVDTVMAVAAPLPAQPVPLAVFGSAGTAATLRFTTQPSGVQASRPISPAVAVSLHDQYGNVATSASQQVTLSLVAGPGTLGGTLTVTSVTGVATFSDLTVSAPGTYQLRATVAGLPVATSASFTVTP